MIHMLYLIVINNRSLLHVRRHLLLHLIHIHQIRVLMLHHIGVRWLHIWILLKYLMLRWLLLHNGVAIFVMLMLHILSLLLSHTNSILALWMIVHSNFVWHLLLLRKRDLLIELTRTRWYVSIDRWNFETIVWTLHWSNNNFKKNNN